ncbi:hypothetical protein [Xanthomonas campestris]|uniref:hypothetical protein n=1 Tax=Xanthomonas campestris TaxID=339 RepID=UPI001E4FE6E8|nr:hypothetical protein [Xanthomonas campestris]MCC5072272.1 hypothetical protein [Xanthomonas campestris pv. plantaginis]
MAGTSTNARRAWRSDRANSAPATYRAKEPSTAQITAGTADTASVFVISVAIGISVAVAVAVADVADVAVAVVAVVVAVVVVVVVVVVVAVAVAVAFDLAVAVPGPLPQRRRRWANPTGAARKDARHFRQGQDVPSENSRRLRAPEGRVGGVCFLLVTFLCTSKEK